MSRDAGVVRAAMDYARSVAVDPELGVDAGHPGGAPPAATPLAGAGLREQRDDRASTALSGVCR